MRTRAGNGQSGVNGKNKVRIARREKTSPGGVRTVWAVGLIVVAVASGITILQRRDGGGPSPGAVSGAAPGISLLTEMWTRRGSVPERLVYPYSVVPGGVATPEDIAAAIARDPVVAGHYHGFDARRARVATVKEPRLVYVSYRIKDQIYYTKKQVSLHPGERIVTDGKNEIRGRCGNRIVDAPQAQVSLLEPPEEVLNTPELPQVAMSQPLAT